MRIPAIPSQTKSDNNHNHYNPMQNSNIPRMNQYMGNHHMQQQQFQFSNNQNLNNSYFQPPSNDYYKCLINKNSQHNSFLMNSSYIGGIGGGNMQQNSVNKSKKNSIFSNKSNANLINFNLTSPLNNDAISNKSFNINIEK